MNFWIEHDDDGGVLRAVMSDETPDPQMGGVMLATDRIYEPGQTWVIDGAPADFGPPPSYRHVMDPTTRTWAVPGKTALQVAQDAKWAQIRTERDRREQTTFPYMGKQLQCDAVSTLRMSKAKEAALAALEAGAPFSEVWTCADNTQLPMTANDILGMLPALAAWSSGLHATGRALRAQIYHSSATLESVASTVWPTD